MKKFSSLGIFLVIASLVLVGCIGGDSTRTYSVSGTIQDSEGSGISGVVLLLEGSDIEPFVAEPTDADGKWSADSLKGKVTITPELEGWIFNPAQIEVTKASKKADFVGQKGEGLVINVVGQGKVLREVLSSTQSTDYYLPGTTVRLTAIPEIEFLFSHWEGDIPKDADAHAESIDITLDGPKEITAVFKEMASFWGTFRVKHNFPASIVEEQSAASGEAQSIVKMPKEEAFQGGNGFGDAVEGELIVRFAAGSDPEASVAELEARGYTVIDNIPILNAYLVSYDAEKTSLQVSNDLAQIKNVNHVEENYYGYGSGKIATPNDRYYPEQWHYPMVRLPQAWTVTKGDSSIRVAVIDSGLEIDPIHQDLKDNVNFDLMVNFVRGESFEEVHWHGTHVAGTIGAVTDNDFGVAGVMWEVEIIPVKVLDIANRCSMWDVAQGILYSAGLIEASEEKGIPHNPAPVDIMNISIGGPHTQLQAEAVKLATEAGSIIVASAGNETRGFISYPAAYPEVIAVGAVGRMYEGDDIPPIASYSNYSDMIDVVAPGGGGRYDDDYVISTFTAPYHAGYGFASGTSMASPHVAGVIGLMLANGIPKDEVREILHRTSMKIGDPAKYGHGLINAYWAVNDVSEMRVIQGIRTGNTMDVIAETTIDLHGGQLLLEMIPVDACQIVGWIDVNGNDIIDAGDYYVEWDVSEGIQGGWNYYWIADLEEVGLDFLEESQGLTSGTFTAKPKN